MTIFCNTDESGGEQHEYVQILLQKQVDGFLLGPASDASESPALLLVAPFLTVAAQPAYEIGRRAAELLLMRLAGDEMNPKAQEIVLPPQLVIRRSSGPPRRGA